MKKILKCCLALYFSTTFLLHAESKSYFTRIPIDSVTISSNSLHPSFRTTGLTGMVWYDKQNIFSVMPFYCLQIMQRANQNFFLGQGLGLRFMNKNKGFILGSHLLFVKDLNVLALGVEYCTPLTQIILHFHSDTISFNDKRKKDLVVNALGFSRNFFHDRYASDERFKHNYFGAVEYYYHRGVRLQTIWSIHPVIDVHMVLHCQYSHFNFQMNAYRSYAHSRGIYKDNYAFDNYGGYLYQSGVTVGINYKLLERTDCTSKLYGEFIYDTLKGYRMRFELSLQYITAPTRDTLLRKMYQPIHYIGPIYPTSIEMGSISTQVMQEAVEQAQNTEVRNASLYIRNMVADNVNTLEKMYGKHSFSAKIAEQSAYLFWAMPPKNKQALCDTVSKMQQFTKTSGKSLPIEIRTNIYKDCISHQGHKFIQQGLNTQQFNLTKKNRDQHYEYINNLIEHILQVCHKKCQNTHEKQLCISLDTAFSCQDILDTARFKRRIIGREKTYHLFHLDT